MYVHVTVPYGQDGWPIGPTFYRFYLMRKLQNIPSKFFSLGKFQNQLSTHHRRVQIQRLRIL